jgi:short-subunit dehydrogenase
VIAFVTGTSSGLGEAFVSRLAGDGWDLVITARRGERLDALAGWLTARHEVSVQTRGRDLSGTPFPVRQPDEVVGAALAGLRLGETVCIPGLPDPSMLDPVSQAQRALFMTAVGGLAGRYAPTPQNMTEGAH